MSGERTVRRAVVHALHAEESVTAVMERVIAACRGACARGPWSDVARLAFEREQEALALWLVDALDREPPPEGLERIDFRLRVVEWNGRVDECALELCGEGWPRERAATGSAVLTRLFRLAESEPDPESARLLATQVPLAFAAASVRHALERIDPRLVLGDAFERAVLVELEDGSRLAVGRLEREGWAPAQSS